MTKEKKPAKRIYTLAAAIGLALGAMGIAGAATSGSTPATEQVQPAAVTAEESTAPEVAEAPGDEATDGIDHQFEGEEVGNNGDGVADANEASEVESPSDEGAEVEAPGDEADGIDHQFEGEEVGNNGDGIPDANEANEAVEAPTSG